MHAFWVFVLCVWCDQSSWVLVLICGLVQVFETWI